MIFPGVERLLARLGRFYLELLVRVVDFSITRAKVTAGLFLFLVLAAGFYAFGHFAVDTNTSNVLSRDLPFQQRQTDYKKAFPQDPESIVVVLEGRDASATGAAVDRLETWLHAHPALFRDVYVPGGGSFFRRNGLLYLSVAQVQDFASRITQAQPLIARLSADPSLAGLSDLLSQAVHQRLQDGTSIPGLTPIYEAFAQSIEAQLGGNSRHISWGSLMAGDSPHLGSQKRFVIIQPALDYGSLQPAQKAILALRSGLERMGFGRTGGVQVGITGQAVLDSEQMKTVSQGAFFSLALTLGLEILLLVLSLRSARLVIGVLLNLVAGMVLTAAWGLFFIGPFNLISVAFAILFIGLGVDFGIQFGFRFREELFNGAPHREALHRVAWGMGGALSLAAVSAAISFYAFVPTSYAGIVDLGLVSGTSMLVALALTLTLMPAILTLWPVSPAALKRVTFPHLRHAPTLARHRIHRYAYVVLAGVGLLAILAVPAALRVSFDFNPLHMIDSQAEGVRVFESLLGDPEAAPYRIEILAPNLSAAGAVAQRLEKLPSVSRALTLASYLPGHQAEKLGILQNLQILVPPFSLLTPAALVPPKADTLKKLVVLQKSLVQLASGDNSAQGQAAGRLAAALGRFLPTAERNSRAVGELQQSVLGTLPAELQRLGQVLMASRVTLAGLPESLRSRYVNAQGQARVEVFPKENLRSNTQMERFVHSVLQVEPDAVGTPVMLVEGGNAVLSAFQEATYIALGAIGLLLVLTLRRYRDMLLVMAPLLLAALFTVAAMSLLGLQFNLGNIIVLPLLIGLGVAFGIYIVIRWRGGVDAAHLLETSTPMAVFFSGLTTLSAFGSMALSRDPGMSTLGEALSLSLAIVLLCILVVLPALLLLFTESPKEDGVAQDEGS